MILDLAEKADSNRVELEAADFRQNSEVWGLVENTVWQPFS